jgi:hypothetical protein
MNDVLIHLQAFMGTVTLRQFDRAVVELFEVFVQA